MGQAGGKQKPSQADGKAVLDKSFSFSVIIPALNESRFITSSLSSVHLAVVEPVDVVVVDGGSTDNTADLARQHGAEVVQAHRGRGRQLNTGWRATRGEWCLFLHSDSVLPPQYDKLIAASIRRASRQRQHRQWAAPRGPPAHERVFSPLVTNEATDTRETAIRHTPPPTSSSSRTCSGTCYTALASARGSPGMPSSIEDVSQHPKLASDAGASKRGGGSGAAQQGTCQSGSLVMPSPHRPISRSSGGGGGSGDGGPRSRHGGSGWAARLIGCPASGAEGGCVPDLDPSWEAPGGPTWGAFATIQTDLHNPVLRKMLSAGVELRTRLLWKPYGDQALFIRRDVLEACGGFVEWPLLEDLEMVERLAKEQRPVIVDAAITTSGRRWQSVGFLFTTLINQAILVGYALGVSPETLARWYLEVKRAS